MASSLAALLAAAQNQLWQTKLAGLAAYTLASAFALRAGSGEVAAPARRLALALLFVAGNAVVPLLFHRTREGVSVAFSSFILTWLASFKALALAVGRGPLAQRRWAPLQFWALYALPLVPAAPQAAAPRRRPSRQTLEGPGEPAHLLLRWLVKAAVTAGVVFCLLLEVPPFARTCLYVLGIYSMLGVVMDGPAACLLRPLRLDLAPHFLPPWESASLAEFWGTRWNQAAGSSLRTSIYEPIVEGSLVDWQQLAALTAAASASGGSSASAGRGRRRSARLAAAAAAEGPATVRGADASGARLAGMAASFFASGAVHELIFWYVHGHLSARLAWLAFFLGQVPLILGERWLLGQLKAAGVALPGLARRALTLGVLLATSHHLFFQPAEAAGLPALFAASMRDSYAALAALPLRLLGSAA